MSISTDEYGAPLYYRGREGSVTTLDPEVTDSIAYY